MGVDVPRDRYFAVAEDLAHDVDWSVLTQSECRVRVTTVVKASVSELKPFEQRDPHSRTEVAPSYGGSFQTAEYPAFGSGVAVDQCLFACSCNASTTMLYIHEERARLKRIINERSKPKPPENPTDTH